MIRTITLFVVLLALGGCDWMPGKPAPSTRWKPASEISDFPTLYRQNCLGCHGIDQMVSGSISMDTPAYLSVLPREVLLNTVSQGIPATAMPGFSVAAGGTLTGDQIEILVNGIMAKKPAALPVSLPPYSAEPGDPVRGAAVFAAACASCHGENGGGGKAGPVTNPAYLDLVSNQYLRTIVIAGRKNLGCPDFTNRIPGRPMTNEEIADVTAWLISNRKNEFGKPVAPANPTMP